MANDVQYIVVVQRNSQMDSFDSEADAIKSAQSYDSHLEPEVVMVVRSGTAVSRARVWPTQGAAHATNK